jgi:hypothetical protein
MMYQGASYSGSPVQSGPNYGSQEIEYGIARPFQGDYGSGGVGGSSYKGLSPNIAELNVPVKMEFAPDEFLKTSRPSTETVYNAEDVMKWVREAFKTTTGLPFPENIEFEVCNQKRFIELFAESGGTSALGVQGFAINNFGNGNSRVIILEAPLDSMMLTIGHEVGHCLSPSLPDLRDEEAKAMAFSIAWMDKIVKNNIAGLSNSINPNPAKNGVHNVAWDFVVKTLESGTQAIDVFASLIRGSLRYSSQPEAYNG